MKSKKNSKIKYGNVNVPEDAFEDRNVKIRISTFLPIDIIKELKRRALEKGIGYQTLLSQMLREHLFEEKSVESRIERLEKILKVG